MKTYIVRIFRYDRDNPQNIVGAEEVGVEGYRPFKDGNTLWDILNPAKGGVGGLPVLQSPTHVPNTEPKK